MFTILVLDLDETLAYSVFIPTQSLEQHHIVQQYKSFPISSIDLSDGKTCITFYRPFLLSFLTFLKSYFHFLVIFSLGEDDYVHRIAQQIQRVWGHHFDLILTHTDCLLSMKKYHVYKSMNYVKEKIHETYHMDYYDLTVPLFIDDNPLHKVMDPHTHFYSCSPFRPHQINLPATWRLKKELIHQWLQTDDELQKITRYIETHFSSR